MTGTGSNSAQGDAADAGVPYPSSRAEINLTNEVTYFLQMNMTHLNAMFGAALFRINHTTNRSCIGSCTVRVYRKFTIQANPRRRDAKKGRETEAPPLCHPYCVLPDPMIPARHCLFVFLVPQIAEQRILIQHRGHNRSKDTCDDHVVPFKFDDFKLQILVPFHFEVSPPVIPECFRRFRMFRQDDFNADGAICQGDFVKSVKKRSRSRSLERAPPRKRDGVSLDFPSPILYNLITDRSRLPGWDPASIPEIGRSSV